MNNIITRFQETLKTIYNQQLERYTRNWCTVYTLFTIVKLQWGLVYASDKKIRTLKIAEKEKVWNESWGAYFWQIYKWFTDKIKEHYNIDVRVRALDITSNNFENLLNSWYAFWLWIKNANSAYIQATKDWLVDKLEIDKILKQGWWTWHNHTYFKKWDKYFIQDNLQNRITWLYELDIETLRYAVKIWLYYSTARTLILEDRLLDKHLRLWKDWVIVNDIQLLPEAEQKAIARASELRIFDK